MKTYPIFKATFGGSNDYMAHAQVSVAAVSITQAVKRFKKWDACSTGTCGAVGELIYRHEEHGWVRPAEITASYIERDKDLRATRTDWYSVK